MDCLVPALSTRPRRQRDLMRQPQSIEAGAGVDFIERHGLRAPNGGSDVRAFERFAGCEPGGM
jgi:hypothetical protein